MLGVRPASVQPLLAGSSIRASLAGGEETLFAIDVPPQSAAQIFVKQEGIDVRVMLLRPGADRPRDSLDMTAGIAGEETLFPPILDAQTTWNVVVEASLPHAARGDFTIALTIAPADDHSRAIAEARRQYQVAFDTRGGDAKSYQTTVVGYATVVDAALAAGDKPLAAEATYMCGRVHDLLGETPEAIEWQRRALSMFRDLGRRDREARVLNRLGDLSRKVGEIGDAQRYFEDALPLARALHDPAAVADILNNSALVMLWLGQWEETIAQLTAAIPLAQEVGSVDIEGAITHNIGEAWSELGVCDKSIASYQRSLELKRSLNLPRRISRTLRSLAIAWFKSGDRVKAEEAIRNALDLSEKAGDRTGFAETLGVYGLMQYDNGDNDRAVESFARALPLLREVKSRVGQVEVLDKWSEVDIERGDADAALLKLDEALRLARATVDHQNEAKALYVRALAFQKKGTLDDAIASISGAIDIVETMRGAIVRSELRTSYLATVRRYFDLFIELLEQRGSTAMAFQVSERSHARTLLEGLAESALKIRKGIDPQLLKRQRAVQSELNAKESYRGQLVLKEGEKGPHVAAVARKIDRLLDEWKEVDAKIRVTSPAWSALRIPEPVTSGHVQTTLLDARTALVEYHLGDVRSYAWVIDQHAITAHELPALAAINVLARRYHKLLSRDVNALKRVEREAYEKQIATAGRRLAAVVWKPLANRVAGKRLLIVADGALDYVPFAALPDRNDEPLIVHHEIVMLPSASVLDTIRHASRRLPSPATAAVFADPVFSSNDVRVAGATKKSSPVAAAQNRSDSYNRLHFSRAEAEAIVAVASPERSFKALDFSAAKKTLIERDLRKYRIVHFATHGSLNTAQPELSGLVFSLVDESGKPVDGFLRLHEIYNLDLDADLVVLSACSTALGKEVYGEGLIGLTRGFMYAGASRVVSSTWNVDDRASAQLMSRFYTAMLSNRIAPAAALREAQLRLLHQARWASPHYWAAFALQGEWR